MRRKAQKNWKKRRAGLSRKISISVYGKDGHPTGERVARIN